MKIKYLTLVILTCIITMFNSCSTAYAGWFSSGKDELAENKQKLSAVENQLTIQTKNMGYWQIATGSLALAALLLFGIGTALGSQTRYRHASLPGH